MVEKKIDNSMSMNEDAVLMVLDSLSVPMVLWLSDGSFSYPNKTALKLFGSLESNSLMDAFLSLSPTLQPDGQLSKEKMFLMEQEACEQGSVTFEWDYRGFGGELISVEITFVHLVYQGAPAFLSYTRDLREQKRMLAEMREADERAQIMLDATPLCCNFWDEDVNNTDCNQEAVRLFELKDKKEYLDRFSELSPEYQPDGQLSSEKTATFVKRAFEEGRAVFEWMHQKPNGDPVPSEITLVRVKQGEKNIVVGYTRDLRELKMTVDRLDQLEKLAFTDSGTNVYNKRYFMTNAERVFSTSGLQKETPAIFMMDLDKFKSINDTYGHLAGDEVLRTVAQTTKDILRPSDLLARYGGEEFIILIKEADQEVAEMLGERIRSAIESLAVFYDGTTIDVTVSLGIALRSNKSETLEHVINRADKNMYRAKQNGRNLIEADWPCTRKASL